MAVATFTEGPCKTFQAGGAIGQYLRVKLSSGKLALAGVGASDDAVEIGTAEEPAFADLEYIAVRLRSAAGTCKMVAGEALNAGVAVYGAANGKVADTASGTAIGISMEAAAADGDIIEVLRY